MWSVLGMYPVLLTCRLRGHLKTYNAVHKSNVLRWCIQSFEISSKFVVLCRPDARGVKSCLFDERLPVFRPEIVRKSLYRPE